MQFEWDSDKDKINQRKHHISFSTAQRVFLDENRIDEPDDEHSKNEPRRITIGKSGKILFVVYTERHYDIADTIRIISARRANDEERRLYYDRDIVFRP